MNPKRSAHASIRGYLYQTCLGVWRWLELGTGELLLCEGDEDLDRLIRRGGGISEQVKAGHGAVNIRDPAVLESLRQFLLTYVALQEKDETRRFLFTTTARRRRQRTEDLGVDVLASWNEPAQRDAVIAALCGLLPPKEGDAFREGVLEALAWLEEEPVRWAEFLDSVEWAFDAPDVEGVRHRIADALAARSDTEALPVEILIDRLVADVLKASSQAEPAKRTRTRADLERLLAKAKQELVRWEMTPEARRLRLAFEEIRQLRRLLHDGTLGLLDEGLGPDKLLTADYEVIPFAEGGRREELDALAKWCDNPNRLSVWLWVSEGGVGKTRLMIEWCRRLACQGWHAGFLKPNRTAEDFVHLQEGIVPRLVVVDYAETRLSVVRTLLQEMAYSQNGGPKLRVVLLARRSADWWTDLQREDRNVKQLLAVHSPQPRSLGSLFVCAETREAAFREAVWTFASVLRRDVPKELPVPDLTRHDFDRVLFLQMAALAVVDGKRIEYGRDALAETLSHERRFWHREVAELGLDRVENKTLEEAIESFVAALTLVGGAKDIEEARVLVERTTAKMLLREDVRAAMTGLLRRIYAGEAEREGRFLEGLQPDLLGEELVIENLTRDASLLDRIFDAVNIERRIRALALLLRLPDRHPQARDWVQVVLNKLHFHYSFQYPLRLRGVPKSDDRPDTSLLLSYVEGLERLYEVMTGPPWNRPIPITGKSGKTQVFICDLSFNGGRPFTTFDRHRVPVIMLPRCTSEPTSAERRRSAAAMAVHEGMHLFNSSQRPYYDISSEPWAWLDEGIAIFMETIVLPGNPDHLRFLMDWIDRPNEPLDDSSSIYQAGFFVHYLAKKMGIGFLNRLWTESKPHEVPLEALERLMPRGQRFTSADPNEQDLFASGYAMDAYFLCDPASDCFSAEVWRRYGDRAVAQSFDLKGGAAASAQGALRHLACRYYRIYPQANVTKLRIELTSDNDKGALKAEVAVVTPDRRRGWRGVLSPPPGPRRAEHLSLSIELADLGSELDHLVLVITNCAWTDIRRPPNFRSAGCPYLIKVFTSEHSKLPE